MDENNDPQYEHEPQPSTWQPIKAANDDTKKVETRKLYEGSTQYHENVNGTTAAIRSKAFILITRKRSSTQRMWSFQFRGYLSLRRAALLLECLFFFIHLLIALSHLCISPSTASKHRSLKVATRMHISRLELREHCKPFLLEYPR